MMSFSDEVKKELSKIKLESKLEALIELSSILKVNASVSIRNAFININFVSESRYVVNRIYKLIDYLYEYECTITKYENNNIKKEGFYSLNVENEDVVNKIISDSGFDLFGNYTVEISALYSRIISAKEKGLSSYLRGTFIGAGSIVDPKKSYHLELVFNNEEDSKLLNEVLRHLKIETLNNNRKGKYIVYIKNSDTISNFLGDIKATNSMLKFENIRVEKELKNNINRRINFDMANLNKTLETSLLQIKYIEKLEKNNMLPDELKEISRIRKENPEYSLKTIGKLLKNPISKSSVAYKMNKLKDLAEKI